MEEFGPLACHVVKDTSLAMEKQLVYPTILEIAGHWQD